MNDTGDTGLSNEAALKEAGNKHILMHASPYGALGSDSAKRILVEGKGCVVTDIDGNEFIDALAGLWLVNVGHGRQAGLCLFDPGDDDSGNPAGDAAVRKLRRAI